MRICATTPIPDFNGLYEAARASMTFPPQGITVPALPSLRNPIYPGLSRTNDEIVQLVQELQSYQMLTTFSSFLNPLTSFLGLSPASILPKIPGTALNLIDLLAMSPGAIYDGVAAALAEYGSGIFPFVKTPIFQGLSIPSIEIVTTVKMAIKGYMNTLLGTVSGLIDQVTGKLKLPGMPALPTLPSFEAISAQIMGAFPGFPDLSALIRSGSVSLNALLASVGALVPAFPALPALPEPLIPNLSSFEHEFNEGLNVLYSSLVAYPMTLIMNFVTSTLSMLGFSFPAMCITF
ncbi:hypothetical protein [Pandoraea sp. SD6-2]|uniref:hypothetical protein n=1 Tax=Pandoraea sp. SD6-2 TaxID=1286093 RepID=UPI0003313E41|nr:hypothetical protein [Pandoraea sp. SD6-2]EON13161.1 hypothetical protein C266_14154 [Pandoraea sp. SD6-2]